MLNVAVKCPAELMLNCDAVHSCLDDLSLLNFNGKICGSLAYGATE